jgi:hydrogenase maturation protein HypF
MCLGIPGRVVAVLPGNGGQLATVDVVGVERAVNIGMLDVAPEPGDWVLIHLGFAVEVIDAERAGRAMAGLELVGRARTVRRRFTVAGLVQGVGFRPFAYTTATGLGLAGSVANTADGVSVEVEGCPDAVHEYGLRLREGPPLARVTAVDESDQPVRGGSGFRIEASSGGPGRTPAPPDVAICDDCLGELRDPGDRRFRHPFISCVNCGPRFTIIKRLPYDRAATTMAGFRMCGRCRGEYENPADRRFHAQPIACHDCGPRLELVLGNMSMTGEDAIHEARALLAAGRIVAIKGIGGYHLACDARNDDAVAELRRRKRRGGKPFAVMAAGLRTAYRIAALTESDRSLLVGARRPVVLAPRRDAGASGRAGPGRTDRGGPGPGAPDRTERSVSEQVAPGCTDLGVMLPYTPLHVLLFGLPGDPPGPDVLVMTSGNVAGEPIVTDDAEALRRLEPLADAWLRHDRRIRVPCDDSVVRPPVLIRRARGYAPMPLELPFEVRPSLAVGADLKNACALGGGRQAWMSPHIGDMGELSTVEALGTMERHLERIAGVRPEVLVADLHPGYRSAAWARANADGRPVRTVQHHHAHIASVMAEHGLGVDERVIGIAFDGTGYGTDGAIWGGEVIVAGYRDFHRDGHLGYVALPGGDASVRRTYRMALSHLRAAGVPWEPGLPPVDACPPAEREVLAHQLGTGLNCAPTSSMGRLFDAVAALAGIRQTVTYEGEAAMLLEAACTGELDRAYEMRGDSDPGPLIRAVAADVHAGVPAAVIAGRFHATVIALTVAMVEGCRERTGLGVAALGGGVFQNTTLTVTICRELRERGFTVLVPRLLPPNDGGIALGQLAVAAGS